MAEVSREKWGTLKSAVADIDVLFEDATPVPLPAPEPEPTPEPEPPPSDDVDQPSVIQPPTPEPTPTPEPIPSPVVIPPVVPITEGIDYVPATPDQMDPTFGENHQAILNIQEGERLSGVIDFSQPQPDNIITPYVTFPGLYGEKIDVPDADWWMAIDNVSVGGKVIDFSKVPDGMHMLHVFTNLANPNITGCAKVIEVNNSDTALKQTRLPVNAVKFGQLILESHATAWVPVREREASPLKSWHKRNPLSLTDEQRQFLATEAQWTQEGFNNNYPCPLYLTWPELLKNSHGSHFIGQIQTQANTFTKHAVTNVSQQPAYDGPRGKNYLSPYSTVNQGHQILASGFMAFLGIQPDGRIVDIDYDGSVHTWFGPRSVEGVVHSDNMERALVSQKRGSYSDWHAPIKTKTLAERVADGEKEYIGDHNGYDWLWGAQDIWVDPDNLDTHYVADTLNNRIAVISRTTQRIVEVLPCADVSSVWTCHVLKDLGIRFVATSPQGLHIFWTNAGTEPKLIPVADAFWIRGKQFDSNRSASRILIMTSRFGEFYMWNPFTDHLVRIKEADGNGVQAFSFFAWDVLGLIGPKNRVYYSYVNSPNSNTGIRMFDPFLPGVVAESFRPKGHSTINQTDNPDRWGHYIWGFALPHHRPGVFLTTGMSQAGGWYIHRAYVGEQPIAIPRAPNTELGRKLFQKGKKNIFPPISTIFGGGGSGGIGYTADMFRGMSLAEAKAVMTNPEKPLLPVNLVGRGLVTQEEIDAIAGYIWSLRTQDHFVDGAGTTSFPTPTSTPTPISTTTPAPATTTTPVPAPTAGDFLSAVARAKKDGWAQFGSPISTVWPVLQSGDLRKIGIAQPAILTAWNGAAYDYDERALYFVANGGHVDYAGNETYRFLIDSATWTRLNDGAMPVVYPGGSETPYGGARGTALIPPIEQGPSAGHTYGGVQYSRLTKTIFWTCGIYSIEFSSYGELWEHNPSQAEQRNGLPPLGWRLYYGADGKPLARVGGHGACETTDGLIWMGMGGNMRRFDPRDPVGTLTPALVGPGADYGLGMTVFDADRNCIWFLAPHNRKLFRLNLDKTRAMYDWPDEMGPNSTAHGMVLRNGKLVFWDGVNRTLDFDPDTLAWRHWDWSLKGEVVGSRRVYSKWVYLSDEDVCVGVSDETTGMLVYHHPVD